MPDWRALSVWTQLIALPEVQAAAEAVHPTDASAIARLRRSADADLVSAALELAQARRKAALKFPSSRAAELWCDVAGVEQASGELVAAWKALRMREVLGEGGQILDLCCGIGGDAMALSKCGLRVTAIDLDPRRAWMAEQNARCAVQVADAESLAFEGAVLHADPARRDEAAGSRSWKVDDHTPGRAWMERALTITRAGAIKFSPGVDRREFRSIPLEWEFIETRDGHTARLVQAVAWSGAFARAAGCTRATVLSNDATPATLVGVPDDARADRIGIAAAVRVDDWISEPCAALERAQLLTTAVGGEARELVYGVGLVTSPSPLAAPWFESFRVVEECAAKAQVIAEVLTRHGLRARSVRVRGQAADADALTKALRARSDGDAVIFAFRRGERTKALIARIDRSST